MSPVRTGQPLAVYQAERWLTDRCTLEQPDRTASGGWTTVGTDVPCRLIDPPARVVLTTGGLPNVQQPRVYFSQRRALAVDWRITVTSQADRRLKIDSVQASPEAPLQIATASGTR